MKDKKNVIKETKKIVIIALPFTLGLITRYICERTNIDPMSMRGCTIMAGMLIICTAVRNIFNRMIDKVNEKTEDWDPGNGSFDKRGVCSFFVIYEKNRDAIILLYLDHTNKGVLCRSKKMRRYLLWKNLRFDITNVMKNTTR